MSIDSGIRFRLEKGGQRQHLLELPYLPLRIPDLSKRAKTMLAEESDGLLILQPK